MVSAMGPLLQNEAGAIMQTKSNVIDCGNLIEVDANDDPGALM